MSATGLQTADSRLLASLALAMVERPRATLMELAKTVGTSKATLYRHCRTREELVARLMAHCKKQLVESIRRAQLDTAPPLEALRHLNASHLEYRELIAFMVYFRREKEATQDPKQEQEWSRALDAFFLRGQRQGVFRIDIPAAGLTELWAAIMVGLVDAERRGRIARAGLASMLESALLDGVSAR